MTIFFSNISACRTQYVQLLVDIDRVITVWTDSTVMTVTHTTALKFHIFLRITEYKLITQAMKTRPDHLQYSPYQYA